MAPFTLEPARIHSTLEVLKMRIDERFPGAGLGEVCQRLLEQSAKAQATVDSIQQPILALRIVIGVLVAVIVAGVSVSLYEMTLPEEPLTIVDFIQLLEAGINDVVLIGLGAFFLLSLERRVKRGRALAALHELRSIAHVIDMHQLTKDPAHLRAELPDTPSSPRRTMKAARLERYLDYCSEMLSLVGKLAALYAERFTDEVVLASVNEVEALTTGLSGKIWQKVVILETDVR